MRRGRRDEPAKIDGAIQCFGLRLVEKRPAADSSSWRLPGQGRRPSMRCALSMRARHSAESMVRTAWSRARERKSTRQKISPFGGEKSEKKYISLRLRTPPRPPCLLAPPFARPLLLLPLPSPRLALLRWFPRGGLLPRPRLPRPRPRSPRR